MKIIDNQNRKVLGEGRNFGMGFAFLKKTGVGQYETVQPISPCKDYLNDVVYSEATGKPCTAYGLKYTKHDIFTSKVEGYICFSILDYWDGKAYPKRQEEIDLVKQNYKHIEALFNHFEKEIFHLKSRTRIYQIEDNLYLCKIPLFWCKATYRISLWSLLCRCAMWYDGSQSPMDYLKTVKGPDQYLLSSVLPKIDRMREGNIPEQDLAHMYGGTQVHNCGVVEYSF
jgi:hypothetical protein